MSIRVMSAVWELDLPDSEKLIALALADWANDEGECWPSVAQIAKKATKGERTVQGVLKSLEKKGYLRRHFKPGRGCIYRLDPRRACTPAEPAPPQPLHETPAAAAPNTSGTVKQRKDKPSSGKRAKVDHELPEDWEPKAFGPKTQSAAIMAEWPPGELMLQLEHFRAHHGKNGTKFKNWQDAWSTWVLNSRKFGNVRTSRQSYSGEVPGDGRTIGAAKSLIADFRAARAGAC